jgi:hypothetical protein
VVGSLPLGPADVSSCLRWAGGECVLLVILSIDESGANASNGMVHLVTDMHVTLLAGSARCSEDCTPGKAGSTPFKEPVLAWLQ